MSDEVSPSLSVSYPFNFRGDRIRLLMIVMYLYKIEDHHQDCSIINNLTL